MDLAYACSQQPKHRARALMQYPATRHYTHPKTTKRNHIVPSIEEPRFYDSVWKSASLACSGSITGNLYCPLLSLLRTHIGCTPSLITAFQSLRGKNLVFFVFLPTQRPFAKTGYRTRALVILSNAPKSLMITTFIHPSQLSPLVFSNHSFYR